MDIADALGLEFLDLSEVDEYERSRVVASLQPSKPNAKFPWFIGNEKDAESVLPVLKKPTTAQTQPEVTSHDYMSQTTDPTRRAAIPIINPVNGLPVSLNSSPVPITNQHTVQNNSEVNSVNGPIPQPINNQFYNPVPQYYHPPSVVTTIPNVPVHMPQNYENYSVPNTSQHEMPVNNTLYTTYISQNYPGKPVYYGAPPAQPIFISHPTAVAAPGPYYPNTPHFAQTVPSQNSPSVQNPDDSRVEPQNHVPQNHWVENENLKSCSEDSAQRTKILTSVSNSVPNQDTAVAKPLSPVLSADTPAFTPKNTQNISLESQKHPVDPEPIITVPEPIKDECTLETPDPNVSTFVGNVQKPEESDNTPKVNGPWGTRKTWASLFTPKEGTGGSQVNGLTKPALIEAVNKESNNNNGEVTCPIKNPKRSQFVDPDCYRMGEFLSNYAVDGRTISLQPRGLINQSNYCYINSILQALIACPPMYNLLNGLSQNVTSNEKRKPTPVIDGMCRFVKEFKHLPANMRVSNRRSDNKRDQKKDQGVLINTDIPFEPSWIYKILNGIRTDLIEGRQEDAEEFLGCLLNSLNDEMLELIKLIKNDDEVNSVQNNSHSASEEDESWQVMGSKNKGSVQRKTVFERTPVSDIFGGSLKSRIHKTGDLITENTQPFLTLQLNIEKVKTVKEALEALTTKYQLEGVTSSKTNEEVEAWQQVMLDELPVVLVLHLKCFDFQLDGCTKIIKALEFPIDLKIDPKLLSSSKTANAKEKQYKLFAVVYHDGKEATKGHYVTDAFHVGYSSWLRYDDATVKQVQEEQVLKPQGTRVPYLLFYRRSDTIRSR